MRIRVKEKTDNNGSVNIKRKISQSEIDRQVELVMQRSLAEGAPF